MSNSPEYTVWRAIQQRCHNPKNTAYSDYGGRGIAVCQRWRESFEAFYADTGARPSPEMTLDRIDNERGYEPGNVRWATRIEQSQNTRWTHEARVAYGRRNAMKRWHPDHV